MLAKLLTTAAVVSTRASIIANMVQNGSCKMACTLPGARVRVRIGIGGVACAPKRFNGCTSHCLQLGGVSISPGRC